ncbi:hypothetical protein [Pseudonocardia sp. N23]|uniref:hypothetical protein n=1 Tax=Pseudonocardia sp. N23 TaxID=1987376 RepID=UPI00114596EB|nr:hypothetical protein [Pseudonocardia sp. N23]
MSLTATDSDEQTFSTIIPSMGRLLAARRMREAAKYPLSDEAAAVTPEGIAAAVQHLSGIRATPLLVGTDGVGHFAQILGRLPVEVGAIVIAATDATLAREVRSILAEQSTRPVITEADAEAISTLAAIVTYLNRTRGTPRGARVVIAGASRLPLLCALLLTAGVFDIVMWEPRDDGPLSNLVRDADVVVNLMDDDEQIVQISWDRPCGSVISPPPQAGVLPLPGLVRAISRAAAPVINVAVCHACAVGMVNTTPASRLAPVLTEPRLAFEVAAQASRLLGPGNTENMPPP